MQIKLHLCVDGYVVYKKIKKVALTSLIIPAIFRLGIRISFQPREVSG